MHKVGWVHRDVSVGNGLWIIKQGTGKLAGFEYAKCIHSNKSHDVRTGTPHFMAVEVDAKGYLFSTDEGEEPPFRMNGLHDMESVWWTLIWVLFYYTDQNHPTVDLVNQWNTLQAIFPSVLGRTSRLVFFTKFKLVTARRSRRHVSPFVNFFTNLRVTCETAIGGRRNRFRSSNLKISWKAFIGRLRRICSMYTRNMYTEMRAMLSFAPCVDFLHAKGQTQRFKHHQRCRKRGGVRSSTRIWIAYRWYTVVSLKQFTEQACFLSPKTDASQSTTKYQVHMMITAYISTAHMWENKFQQCAQSSYFSSLIGSISQSSRIPRDGQVI
ncbi:hypothetical protein SERLADRAFT_471972 [Serpula lacrymans var. lacrymans S7.9]|nr:uncharacterized protein SERLADRAFT_471972 [Serpula lacrymans var. lacrymans S7.9]EGO23169.1 hypothetical protein SERLADRAFT_471972 [Serpula lacrymans var. lacrymans S7.9]